MKATLAALAVLAVLSLGAGQAAARPASHYAITTVTVVMHDPGCHWFAVGSSFLKTYSVAGPVKLVDYDEAALKVVGPHGLLLAKQGKSLLLAKGVYRITMVGQAPDDNHLRLTVR
jgi:hypothetical protein